MNTPRWTITTTGLAMLLMTASQVRAQVERRGGEASAALLEQIQQLASERTSLQADNARLKRELDDMRKERDSLKSAQKAVDLRAKASAAALAQSTVQRESTERQLQQMKARMDELIAKFRETIETLRQIESDRNTTKQALASRDQELKICVDRNLGLYKLNDEILARWDKQSFFSRLASAEPFTKLARTRNENLIDDFKVRADELRVTSGSVKAAAAMAPPAAPRSITPASSAPGTQASGGQTVSPQRSGESGTAAKSANPSSAEARSPPKPK